MLESALSVCVLLLLSGLFFCLYVTSLRHRRLMEDLPTSKTTGVFIGLVELKGTAEADPPITAPFSGKSCVYCKWSVSEEHKVSGDSSDSDKITWDELDSGSSDEEAFYLRDDKGRILVHPKGAEIETVESFSETVDKSSPIYEWNDLPELSRSTHQRRFKEEIIELDAPIYLIGYSRLREDIVAPEIAECPESPIYRISGIDEQALTRSEYRYSWLWRVLGTLLFSIAACGVTLELWPLAILGALLYMFALFAAAVLVMQKSLVHLKNLVIQGLGNVDVQLKRRADLIPQLVPVVEGYRQYEAETLQMAAALRSQAIPKNLVESRGVVERPLAACTPSLDRLTDCCPELKASKLFQELQRELADTESRVSMARLYYNGIVEAYNTRLRVFPDWLLAAALRLRPYSLLEFEAEAAPNAERIR